MQGIRRQLPQSSSAESPYNLLITNSAFLHAGICSLWCSVLFRAAVQVHSCEALQWLSQALQRVMWSVGGWLPMCAAKGGSEDQCIFIIPDQWISFLPFSSEGFYVPVWEDTSDLSWTICLSKTHIWFLFQTWLFFLASSLHDFEVIVTLPTQSVLQF